MTNSEIIEDYKQAFAEANGREIEVIAHPNGWYSLGMPRKYRILEIERLAHTLWQRARNK